MEARREGVVGRWEVGTLEMEIEEAVEGAETVTEAGAHVVVIGAEGTGAVGVAGELEMKVRGRGAAATQLVVRGAAVRGV